MRRLARVVVLVLTAIGCTAAMTCLASAAPAGHGSGWRKAIEVPGSARLNKGGGAAIEAVSCASAGNCSGAGTYTDASDDGQLFVVCERHGRWGKAAELPGTAKLNAGVNGTASIAGIFCQRTGNCTLAGNYDQANGFTRPFVARQRGGTWASARELHGGSKLNQQSAFTTISSLSCSSASNCAVNSGGDAEVFAMFCNRGGQCAAGGQYEAGQQRFQAFLVSRG
jgi:hypothetical protein